MTNEKEIVLFETKDKKITLPVEVKDETVWLSVSQMAQLFDREESNIRRHVLNVFKENEVDENNNVHFLHVNNVKKPVALEIFINLFVVMMCINHLKKKQPTFCILSQRIIAFMMAISELLRLCFYISWIKMMHCLVRDKNV